jgi:hypothetical protein
MPCRSGCPSQDHQSWGECARASRLQVAGVEAHQYNTNLNRQLDDYAVARRDGLQPETWRAADVNAAYRATDSLGVPYRADKTQEMTQAALTKLGVD